MPNLLASTMRLRSSPRICPMQVSDPPRSPYVSDVSNSVMPRSSALWITLRVASRSMRPPKLLQPRPIADTRRPDAPRLRISKRRCPRSERKQPGDILAAFRRLVKIQQRSGGHDAGRIDPSVALVIVPLDVAHVHRRRDAGDLENVAGVGPQVAIIDQPAKIA